MTSAEIIECLRILGWSIRQFSRESGVARSSIQNWLSGKQQIPDKLAEWLKARAQETKIP